MGLFDFFMSEDKLVAKHIRCLTNVDSQPEDREVSAQWLVALGKPIGLLGLFKRFDMNLEHKLKDGGEKDYIYSLLTQQGQATIEPAKAWLKRCKQVALPLRMLTELAGEQEAMNYAFELLAAEVNKDDFKPQRKKALLIWLTERRDPGIMAVVTPLLKDFDEGVRVAAVEVIIGQQSDDARAALLDVLADPEDDSNRLKVRLAEIFQQRRWSTRGAPDTLAAQLPPPWRVHNELIVQG